MTSSADQPPCAEAARARRDPLAGTAAPARRWLLIEHHGPWRGDVLTSPELDGAVGKAIAAGARAHAARAFLIRRHGRQVTGGALRWAVLDQATGTSRWGTWSRGADLIAAAESLAEPPSEVSGDPLLLVCVHALKDVCCAVRGRPVAAALGERWPEQTWECSHTGGDRFAANLVVLPDGAYYGNLDPASAVSVVEGHLRGQVAAEHLRGVSGQPSPVQAACVEALRRFGPGAIRDVQPAAVEATAPDRWQVRLTGGGHLPRAMSATVTRVLRPPALLTCRATSEALAAEWLVTDLRVDHT